MVLQMGDVLRRIDGRPTRGIGQNISALISGPEGTLVEIQAERAGTPLPPFHIRRGGAIAQNFPGVLHTPGKWSPGVLSQSDRVPATVRPAKSEIAQCLLQRFGPFTAPSQTTAIASSARTGLHSGGCCFASATDEIQHFSESSFPVTGSAVF